MVRSCPSRGFILDLGGSALLLICARSILDKINGKPRPPQIKDKKMACFSPLHSFILYLGGDLVCCFILFCARSILEKINGKPRPPPPQKKTKQNKNKTKTKFKDGKMAHTCPLHSFILDFGGDRVCFSILFCVRSILEKVNGKPRFIYHFWKNRYPFQIPSVEINSFTGISPFRSFY